MSSTPVSTSTKQFVALVAALATVAAAYVAYESGPITTPDVVAALYFAAAGGLAHSLAYKLPKGGFGDISFIPLLSAVAVAPGLPSVAATCVAILASELARRREPIRAIFNVGQFTLSSSLAVIVYTQAGGKAIAVDGTAGLIPFLAAFSAFFVVNALSFAGVVAISTRQRVGSVLVRAVGGALIYDVSAIPFVYGFALAYVRFGVAWNAVLLLPLLGLRHVYKTNWELKTVNEDLLQLMVAAIEARDPYTSGHSQRVASYSRIVCRAAGLGIKATERVFTAALLHDVGKIHEEFAPILRKSGRLTDEEFQVMRSHAVKGAALVGRVTQFGDLVDAVRGHHEAWNGAGYPDGLVAEAIPQWARIIAIADTIDAMTSDRPYRTALSIQAVREELVQQAGRQFDPVIARALASDRYWPEMRASLDLARSDRAPNADLHFEVPRHSGAIAANA